MSQKAIRRVTAQRIPSANNSQTEQNRLLWFLAGLWLGNTAAAQGLMMLIGVVAIIGIVIIGTIFSAFATLVITHWRMMVILGIAALFIAWMVVLYIREERRRVV